MLDTRALVDLRVWLPRVNRSDSFQGLPDEDAALAADAKYAKAQQDNYRPGLFNAADIYNIHSFRKLEKQIKLYINDSRCEMVKGFFVMSHCLEPCFGCGATTIVCL